MCKIISKITILKMTVLIEFERQIFERNTIFAVKRWQAQSMKRGNHA
jgi:hypothetical protein